MKKLEAYLDAEQAARETAERGRDEWRHVAAYYLGDYSNTHTPAECRQEAVRRSLTQGEEAIAALERAEAAEAKFSDSDADRERWTAAYWAENVRAEAAEKDCRTLSEAYAGASRRAEAAEARVKRLEEALAAIVGAPVSTLLSQAANLVRLYGPDDWPFDAIPRDPVVDMAMRVKDAADTQRGLARAALDAR